MITIIMIRIIMIRRRRWGRWSTNINVTIMVVIMHHYQKHNAHDRTHLLLVHLCIIDRILYLHPMLCISLSIHQYWKQIFTGSLSPNTGHLPRSLDMWQFSELCWQLCSNFFIKSVFSISVYHAILFIWFMHIWLCQLSRNALKAFN